MTMFSAGFLPLLFAATLFQRGCGEQEAELRCRALEFYSDQFNRNTDYFDTCDIPPWDRPQCRMITCQNFATSQRPIEELIITPEPCGEDGMRQGVLVTVRNASYQLILNRTFYEPGQAQVGEEVFNIGVEQRSNGVTFGITSTVNDTEVEVLPPINIPIDSTEYVCPSDSRLTQPAATCDAFNSLTVDQGFGQCTTAPSCASFRCLQTSGPTTGWYLGIYLFPCAALPSMQFLFVDGNYVTQFNETVTGTIMGTPFTNSSLGTVNIIMEPNNEFTAFDIMVERIPPVESPTPVTWVQRQTIPFSTEICSSLTTTPEVITTTPEPTEPPTIDYLSAADVRLRGGSVPYRGRLEVRVGGRWGTVCIPNLGFLLGANTACRQLQGGIGQSSEYRTLRYFFQNETGDLMPLEDLPIVMRNVTCSFFENETRIQQCSFLRNVGSCTHEDEVAVECSNCSDHLCTADRNRCVKACDGIKECSDGEDENICNILAHIRLQDLPVWAKATMGVVGVAIVLITLASVTTCLTACFTPGGCLAKDRPTRLKDPDVVTTSYNPAPAVLEVDQGV